MGALNWLMVGVGVGIVGVLASFVLAYLLTAMLYGQRDLLGRRVGGLYHWRIGRVGGSFYIAKRRA